MLGREVAGQGIQRLVVEEQGPRQGPEMAFQLVGQPGDHDRIDAIGIQSRRRVDSRRREIRLLRHQLGQITLQGGAGCRRPGRCRVGRHGLGAARQQAHRKAADLNADAAGSIRQVDVDAAHGTAVGRRQAAMDSQLGGRRGQVVKGFQHEGQGRLAGVLGKEGQAGLEGTVQQDRMDAEV